MKIFQLDPHLDAERRIEVRQRLVEQEYVGLLDDRPADRHPLPLATESWLGLRSRYSSN